MRFTSLLLLAGLAACADSAAPGPDAANDAAIRAVMLSTPALSW
jgi:hypothetical protein